MRVRAHTSGGVSPILEVDESSSENEDSIVYVQNERTNREDIPTGRYFYIGSCIVVTGTLITGIGLWLANLIATYNEDC